MQEVCVICKKLVDIYEMTYVYVALPYAQGLRLCCKEHMRHPGCDVNIANNDKNNGVNKPCDVNIVEQKLMCTT